MVQNPTHDAPKKFFEMSTYHLNNNNVQMEITMIKSSHLWIEYLRKLTKCMNLYKHFYI